jgi:hypothetical protein
MISLCSSDELERVGLRDYVIDRPSFWKNTMHDRQDHLQLKLSFSFKLVIGIQFVALDVHIDVLLFAKH